MNPFWTVETEHGDTALIVAHHIIGILPLCKRATILLSSGRAVDVNHTVAELTRWLVSGQPNPNL